MPLLLKWIWIPIVLGVAVLGSPLLVLRGRSVGRDSIVLVLEDVSLVVVDMVSAIWDLARVEETSSLLSIPETVPLSAHYSGVPSYLSL